MSMLIKNGLVVNADSAFEGDIYCEGEQIRRLGKDLEAPPDAQVIDAKGKYVFPGFIDPHVHIYLPFMGTYAKDTWETAGRAAVIGGTTTLIEMICPSRSDEPLEAFELWRSKADKLACCDYTFHMGVTRYDSAVESQLKEIVKKGGVNSFKIFLAYKGALGVDDDELYQTLSLAKNLDAVVTAHCENADLVAALQKKLIAEGKVGPEWHEPSRPKIIEAEGCRHLMTFAELTGAEVYVVHTSCGEAASAVIEARKRGTRAHIETVAPYLVLDKSHAELPNFEGAKYVMSPPIREKAQQDILWNLLAQREIATIGTDHAPFDFETQKHMGHPDAKKCLNADFEKTGEAGNFTLIPNGIPSVEHRVNLVYTYGVCEGKIDLQTFVDTCSTQAAKIFGLFPRKGVIAPGADADIVIFDPEDDCHISAKDHHMDTDYSAFEGVKIKGQPHAVLLRGKIAALNGKFIGEDACGKFLKRG